MRQEHRLRPRAEVGKLYREGRAWKNRAAALYVMVSPGRPTRVAFAVPKRLGKAVKRNRLRRQFREAYRKSQPSVLPGMKLLFMARAYAASLSFREIEDSVVDLLKRSGVVQ
jgi:ribonuclease P protein component